MQEPCHDIWSFARNAGLSLFIGLKPAARLFLLLLFCLLCLGNQHSIAQILHPSDSESSVEFTINNFGSPVKGSFRGLKGNIVFDPANPTSGNMEVSVDAATIETGINMRNRHLRGEKYFAAEQFPRLVIRSGSIRLGKDAGTFLMSALVTIKSTTRTIHLPFRVQPVRGGLLFEGSFQLNRRDFGVGGGSISLSDEVIIRLKVLAKQ